MAKLDSGQSDADRRLAVERERNHAEQRVSELEDCLTEFVEWFRKHDGKADDFGRFTFVAKAEDLLAKVAQ